MNDIRELKRLASPAPAPQSLAWDGSTLWMGSRATRRLYAINPTVWTVAAEAAAPGTPWGITVVGAELRVLCGETADDHRVIRRYVPGQGFDPDFRIPCPEDSGAQLGWDGRHLYVSQWYAKKVLQLGADGQAARTITVPHGICGQVWVDGLMYLATTDAEETNEYWLTRVDPRPAVPVITNVARIPFPARALAFDGKNFWTNHRAQHQIVSFARPD